MNKYNPISENEQSIIYHSIMQAKNKRAQVQIEADLHATSPEIIKDILRERGVNLRCLNGANLLKKQEPEIIVPVEDIKEAEEAQQWKDIAIPPVEETAAEQAEKIPYTKPEIIEPPVAKKDDKLSQEDLLAIHASQYSPVFREFMQSYIELRQRRRIIIKELREIDYAVKECEDLMNGKLNWADVFKQEDKEDKEMWEYET